jgi:hypothetical protein
MMSAVEKSIMESGSFLSLSLNLPLADVVVRMFAVFEKVGGV